jgi:hypothetical protein
MISASKSTLSLNNIKILRPKVTKNITNWRKKFCESPPRSTCKETWYKKLFDVNVTMSYQFLFFAYNLNKKLNITTYLLSGRPFNTSRPLVGEMKAMIV